MERKTPPAKPSRSKRLPEPDWKAIESAYKGTREPVCSLAKRFGTYDNLIRRRAKKNGWVRVPAEEKRRVVEAALAGVSEGMSDVEARHSQALEQAADIMDMQDGVKVHRNILRAMVRASEALVDESRPDKVPDPRDAKVIAEATEKAINSLRIIRGLKRPGEDNPKESPEEVDADISALEARFRALTQRS